ncbi:MAG: hypothetical protein C5B49_13505 [Bdellovibrio sp.]|nr:MAG: hypothetical protein C5B49_13505 [Bdellovibrio sp.]
MEKVNAQKMKGLRIVSALSFLFAVGGFTPTHSQESSLQPQESSLQGSWNMITEYCDNDPGKTTTIEKGESSLLTFKKIPSQDNSWDVTIESNIAGCPTTSKGSADVSGNSADGSGLKLSAKLTYTHQCKDPGGKTVQEDPQPIEVDMHFSFEKNNLVFRVKSDGCNGGDSVTVFERVQADSKIQPESKPESK